MIRRTVSRLLCMERMSTFTLGDSLRSTVVTSNPSFSGISMSMRTTSGASSLTFWMAAAPSEASPTILKFVLAERQDHNPFRTTGWSSAIKILIFFFAALIPKEPRPARSLAVALVLCIAWLPGLSKRVIGNGIQLALVSQESSHEALEVVTSKKVFGRGCPGCFLEKGASHPVFIGGNPGGFQWRDVKKVDRGLRLSAKGSCLVLASGNGAGNPRPGKGPTRGV